MPCLRRTTVTAKPVLASPRIANIWLSVKFNFLIDHFFKTAEVSNLRLSAVSEVCG
jgi:hypothetical protein